MEPREFYRLATELVKRTDEAASRTVVSRAYYSALNHVAKIVEGNGVKLPDDYRFHEVVADNIGDLSPGLKHQLDYLKNMRGDADYRVWDTWSVDVQDVMNVARRIISIIDEKYSI